MHVCSFDANRLCMLEEKTLKNDFENFPPLNVTASFCAGLEMSFDNDNEKNKSSVNCHYFQIAILHILVSLKETRKKWLEIWHKMDSKSCICTFCVS